MPVEKKGTTTVSTYAHPSSNPTPWHSNQWSNEAPATVSLLAEVSCPLSKNHSKKCLRSINWPYSMTCFTQASHVLERVRICRQRRCMIRTGWELALKIVTPNTLSTGKRAISRNCYCHILIYVFFFTFVICCFFVSSIIMWMLACETRRAKLFEIDF